MRTPVASVKDLCAELHTCGEACAVTLGAGVTTMLVTVLWSVLGLTIITALIRPRQRKPSGLGWISERWLIQHRADEESNPSR